MERLFLDTSQSLPSNDFIVFLRFPLPVALAKQDFERNGPTRLEKEQKFFGEILLRRL